MSEEIKKSVLVVDDNDANIVVLATMLKRLGFDVDEATSGMEAIDHVCQKDYGLIFMDHLMPEMDGIAATRQILFLVKDEKRPIVFGVSATIDKEILAAFEKAGAQDVLAKPVTMEKLQDKLYSLGIIEHNEAGEVIEKEEDGIEGILSSVRGLDYKKGLDMMAGSVENYVRVLAVCIKNILQNYNSIDLIKGTSQKESFALHFHSLKGVFLNIGADEMAEKSKELELAAKAGQMDVISEKVDGYLEDVRDFYSDLEAAYEKYNEKKQNTAPKTEVSDSEFMGKLEQLRQHIEDFEYIEITETLEEMLSGSQGMKREILEKISGAIQESDYDNALALTDELKEKL